MCKRRLFFLTLNTNLLVFLIWFFFFFNDPAPPDISPLPLHAALPIPKPRPSCAPPAIGGPISPHMPSGPTPPPPPATTTSPARSPAGATPVHRDSTHRTASGRGW